MEARAERLAVVVLEPVARLSPRYLRIRNPMVKVKNINLSSTCEHHFVVIDGFATVAYIPSDWVIGLSKINRIVRFFAQRPQVQERLTEQVLAGTWRSASPPRTIA